MVLLLTCCRLMSRLFTPEIAAFYESFYAGKAVSILAVRAVPAKPSVLLMCRSLCSTAAYQLCHAPSIGPLLPICQGML